MRRKINHNTLVMDGPHLATRDCQKAFYVVLHIILLVSFLKREFVKIFGL